ncbi:MAG: hypothetical protein EHM21_17170 [Chloroflexi bacterium]|nr:MAG: hypothetical protein EHM21_17170 [Chloroflexota bacterium]
MNDYSIPGWSFYSHDPPHCGSLAADLDSAGRDEWAAAECLRKGANADEWQLHLQRTLGFKHCRLVSIYNWESFRNMPGALDAVRSPLVQLKPAAVH